MNAAAVTMGKAEGAASIEELYASIDAPVRTRSRLLR